MRKTSHGFIGYVVMIALFILLAVVISRMNTSFTPDQIEYPELLELIEKKEVVFRRVSDASVKMLRLNNYDRDAVKLTSRQKEVCALLENAGDVSVKEVMYYTGVTRSVIDNLVCKNICECFDQEVLRLPEITYSGSGSEVILTDEQQKAYNDLIDLSAHCSASLFSCIEICGSLHSFLH